MISNKKGMHLQSDVGPNILMVFMKKGCKRLNVLKLLKHTIDRETLIKICKAFVRLMLEYDNVV